MEVPSANPSGRDRRAHPRIAFAAEIRVFGTRGPGRAALQDLSLGGARLEVGEPIGAWGDPVTLSLPRPGTGPEFSVAGTIVRTERAGSGHSVGIRFNPLAAPELAQLQRLIDRRG